MIDVEVTALTDAELNEHIHALTGWGLLYYATDGNAMLYLIEEMRDRGFEPELVPWNDAEESAGFWLATSKAAVGMARAPRGNFPRAVAEAAYLALKAVEMAVPHPTEKD